jgi:hypothetical protein
MSSIAKLQRFAEAASANGDAFKSIYDVTLAASQQIFALNNDFFQSFVAGCTVPKSSLDAHELVNTYAQGLERASAYCRDLSDICSKTQVEVFKAGSLSADEATKFFFAEIERLFQSLPMDQSPFSEMLKSVFSNAGSTCEKIIDTSRQMTESSLAVVAHAGQAAGKSAGTTVRSARKTA